MARIYYGQRYKVCEGSGLDSGREGIAMNPAAYSQTFIQKNEPGRYKPFDRSREAILRDDDGRIFTMFKSRLMRTGW